MRSITQLSLSLVLLLLIASCQKNNDSSYRVNGANRVQETDVSQVKGIVNISEKHTMLAKSNNATFDYEHTAIASPPTLQHNQTSATCILRNGNLVYIGWHTHDAANYTTAKYSGAIRCYEVNGSTWTLRAQLDFNELDIHEMALGGGHLYIVGMANPDLSGYPLKWGHRGAVIGKVELDGSGYPVATNYLEKPLTSFGANSVLYVSSGEIYAGTGNQGGHLYKLNDNLLVLDSSALGNVKSISLNSLTNKIGVLRGNRGNSNIMTKFYEFSAGGTLPAENSGVDMPNVNTFLFERNEGAYYNSVYLASSNEGVVEIDPTNGNSVNVVYDDGLTLSVASDTDLKLIYAAAQRAGLKVLWGKGTTDEYDVFGTFAPPSINNNNWYVSDVVSFEDKAFIVSGSRDVVFTDLSGGPYDPIPMSMDLNFTDHTVGFMEDYELNIANNMGSYALTLKNYAVTANSNPWWQGVFMRNKFYNYNGQGDFIKIVRPNVPTSISSLGFLGGNFWSFFSFSGVSPSPSGSYDISLEEPMSLSTETYTRNMSSHAMSNNIESIGESIQLPPGEYTVEITSSDLKFNNSAQDVVWNGAFLLTNETDNAGNPTDNYLMIVNGLNNKYTIDLTNKTGNTTITGFLVRNNHADSPSGSVHLEFEAVP